jgi:BirA family biotin operon repressor/biotin-[acetyl-CoA-carboxylase] ligase
VVAAEEQSAGRGRFPERKWVSESGKNLLCTVFLDPSAASLPGLPIRIGSALCAAADLYAKGLSGLSAPRSCLKWPNDLMIGDRKAAGILCEAGSSGVFAGVGLNCNQVSFPSDLELGATSLARELGREVSRWALLELFLAELAAALGDENWRRSAEGRLWKRGETATFFPGRESSDQRSGRGALQGKLVGIDGEGSLLFRKKGAIVTRAYPAGELRAGH